MSLSDADHLEQLVEAAEDLADLRVSVISARAEMTETGATAIPWQQVKAKLGMACRSSRPCSRARSTETHMSAYRIEVAPEAARQLRKLEPSARRRVQRR